jgi:very-short-patch-repair endonuclease
MLAVMHGGIDKDRDSRGKRRSHDVDARIAAAADRREGVVDRQALEAIGLSGDAIDRRVAAGRLHPLHRGVYAVGHAHLTRNGRCHAALLFAGDGAVLSHRSAADLWELRASKEPEIDVTVATDRRGDAVVRIRRDQLDPKDTMIRQGIRVTKPLRTLLDLAACVDDKQLERAIRQAVYRKLTTTALLAEAVRKRSGRRGAGRMRKALARIGEAPGLIRSDLEHGFLAYLRRHRLPMPELNVEMRIGGRRIEADCVWRAQRVIVELDGRDAHDSAPAFEADRERDLALLAEDWRPARVTSRRLLSNALARDLRAILG